jgi:RNase H-fold protein (predicted Holliday junction resolvase)
MVLLSTFVIKIHWAFENDINRLGVDFGPQLIGLAISTRYYEQALCTIRNKANVLRVCQHILDTADKHNTKEIIVGIPLLEGQKLPLDNKDWLTFNGRMCYDFASALGAVALNRSTEFQVFMF